MKKGDYWRERFNQLEESQNRRGAECATEIERQYRQAQLRIEEKIDRWYQRFADNNGISMQEARILLSGSDLEEFRWDVQDYIRHGKENAVNGRWIKQLENASGRYHISRLEAINLQIQQSVESLYGQQLDSIESAMRDIYINGYYHTAFEIQKGVGVAWNFATLDEKTIDKVIHNPWAADGKNFSERIWQNRQKLAKELNTELVQNIILGEDPQRAIDAIARKMNVSRTNAGRLVMTEEAFFSSAAQRDCFNELGVEQYEIVATLDSHTSDICQAMDGKVFPMSEYEPGITAPPFHVWCRSTTVPAFGDEFDNMGKRAARGESGKTEYVPADMTYKEWKEQFVDESRSADMSENNTVADYLIRSHVPGQDITNERRVVDEVVSGMPPKVQDALKQGTIIDIGKAGASQYDYTHDILYIAKGADKTTVIHEIGHMVENKLMDSSKIAALRKGMVGNVNVFEIVPEVYEDTYSNIVEVLLLKKNTFISDYQGRIYVEANDIFEAFEPDGRFKDDLLWEFVSEGFRQYMEDPEVIKDKCPELFTLIEEAVQ